MLLGGPLRSRRRQPGLPADRADPMIVTKVEQNVIRELGRRPASRSCESVRVLSSEDQERVQEGLHIGRVINEYQEKFQRGDFLVRNVMGATTTGPSQITDVVRVGQTVQLHVRDAETADEDLRSLPREARAITTAGRSGPCSSLATAAAPISSTSPITMCP